MPEQDAAQPNKETVWAKVDRAVDRLFDVTVATLITDVSVGVDELGRISKVATPATPIPAIISNINLATGDVSMEISPALKDDTALTTFHQGVVDKAVEVLPDNIERLVTLVEAIFGARPTAG